MAKVCRIFTDGACSGNPGGPGGWAAIISINGENKKVLRGGSQHTTNNRMELLAVIKAVEKIAKAKKINKFEIFSDSAYVVNAINKNWIESWKIRGWKSVRNEPIKNHDLWVRLDEGLVNAKQVGKEIIFTKVKGHSGNPLNEYADMIAKEEVEKQKKGNM